ncbi:MAG: DUF6364 family protein [Longimicrobiales bacterium]|nr:DUF6364 family protein [Longimicrobiales bacterium]
MKDKLTLTIDADLIPRAKAFARGRGASLSSVVEDALRNLAGEPPPSVVDRWAGRFELRERPDDPRFRALVSKYVHEDDAC